MNLTKDFTLEELIKSDYAIRHGIDNTPTQEQIENLRQLCINILQPLRDAIGVPIHIDSGFRYFEVNQGIGGSKTSQHCEGKAADLTTAEYNPMELVKKIFACKLPFDQLIEEFDEWAHVSFDPSQNRRQILYATKIGGVTKYTPIQL